MDAVNRPTHPGRTEEADTGQVRTCRPAFRESDVDPAADTAGQDADPEPQIVRGED
ncbi:hypothetical protein [Streptomyces aureus]|uniref:hypothetical protein n=1 Tax=Streptomyces aureus TaxID=193461 RepID=UPI000A40D048|nr:hypothetical protein [Streptomyces aureus]